MPRQIQQTLKSNIKFHIPRRFRLPSDIGKPFPPRVFTYTYFDTEHHRLGRLGLTLRKRVENSDAIWQLHIPIGAGRLELEIPSGSRTIPPEFQDLLLAFFRKQPAVQLGKLRTKRTVSHIQTDHVVIAEVIQNSIALIQGKKIAHRFEELEVDRRDDTDRQLQSLCNMLVEAGAQEKTLQQPQIFQALHLPYPLDWKENDSSALPTRHIQDRLHAQFFHILRHDPGTRLGRDSEALHQMRVGTRRFRAILRTARSLFVSEWIDPVRQEMKWLASLLGEVRDWDVLLENLRKNAQDFSQNEQQAFHSVLLHFENQRSIARARLLEGLRSDRYLALLNQLESSFGHLPFRQTPLTLPDLARKAFHKLRDFVHASSGLFPKLELHRTRILLKRARYSCELAEPVLEKGAKRFLQQAKSLQDILGQHQDAVVAEQRLLSFIHHSKNTGIAYVTGIMVERMRTRQLQVAQPIPKQWKKLEK
jgi:CHAD domain-containing protein